jgi:hypothetical protein
MASAHPLLARLKAFKLFGLASAFEALEEEIDAPGTVGRGVAHPVASGGKRRTAGAFHPLPDGRGQIPVAHATSIPSSLARIAPLAEARLRALAPAQFMDAQHNLILVGGTGTGKTHLAIALARAAIRLGRRARFFSVVAPGQPARAGSRPGRPTGPPTPAAGGCHP